MPDILEQFSPQVTGTHTQSENGKSYSFATEIYETSQAFVVVVDIVTTPVEKTLVNQEGNTLTIESVSNSAVDQKMSPLIGWDARPGTLVDTGTTQLDTEYTKYRLGPHTRVYVLPRNQSEQGLLNGDFKVEETIEAQLTDGVLTLILPEVPELQNPVN